MNLEPSVYYVFDSNSSVNVCVVVENGGNEDCPTNAVFYYSVHTRQGNASKD